MKSAPGLNENDSGDTGVLMSNLDRIRDAMPNPVARMLVHHTGKDATKGMRGSSALFAAANTVVELKKVGDGYGVATATKQRDLDASTFTDVGYRLETIPLGINKRGKPFGSCVVRPCEMGQSDTTPKMTENESILYDVLNNIFSNPNRPPVPQNWSKSGGRISVQNSVHKTEAFQWWRTDANTNPNTKDAERMAFSRAIKGLRNQGLVIFHDDFLGQANSREHKTNTF